MKRVNDDRLRNRFFRWIGVLPIDDFDWYSDDIIKVLNTFETFTRRTSNFATIVMKRLDIKDVDDVDGETKKKDEDLRNMFQ